MSSDNEYGYNEHDIVCFEDHDINIYKNDHESVSSLSSESKDNQIDYNVTCTLFNALKEHCLYIKVDYFNKLNYGDIEYYLSNIDSYEQFDISDFEEFYKGNIPIPYKNPNFEQWYSYHIHNLIDTYKYLDRLCKIYILDNNTFYRFCLLGYNTSHLPNFI